MKYKKSKSKNTLRQYNMLFGPNKMFKSRMLSKSLKVQLYRIFIRSVMNDDIVRLAVFMSAHWAGEDRPFTNSWAKNIMNSLIMFIKINVSIDEPRSRTNSSCYLYSSQLFSVLDINVRVLDTVINVITFCLDDNLNCQNSNIYIKINLRVKVELNPSPYFEVFTINFLDFGSYTRF
ncbi:hypothetical protein AGLY_003230 [Aphis glycines]|uniref:Uncharacterized protein n=1 Tax=Aphis glycines TaxID=307491 RepID=A0A6G0U3W9_APHGL|nr:hypothetical protein AGLY_003230 [Aphis glycines]